MADMELSKKVTSTKLTTTVVKTTKKIKECISNFLYTFIKRLFDIFVGIIGIVILIPLTIIISIARVIIKEDKGPVFYTHLRIGKGGRQFKLYKYRSMCLNADEILKKYLKENEEARIEYKKYKKLKHDPRISKFGEILRTTSIDEFPQFLNVFLGNMSLVGPRPYLPREKDDMGDYYNSIIKCKPGITGYWQVNGRSQISFEERLKMDEYYVQHRGLIMDFKIIIKTIVQLISGSSAM